MRRLLAIVLLGGVALALGVLLTPAQSADDYRIDVIFDDSQGLIPGQNVQIAGARVGTIDDVVLTRDFKARIQMKIDGEYAPFKEDATCTIRPQGLIAEYYVDCDPGSPDSKPLEGEGGQAATVPVKNTELPVSPQELFNIWTVPVRERLGLLFNTVGIGTAGLGSDFNEILRRANPSLREANKVIAILRRQKAELAALLDETGPIVSKLAANGDKFRNVVDEADRTTQITAGRSRRLQETVRRLPGLLDVLEPSLRDLNSVVENGTPVVRDLRAAAPALNRLNAHIGPFAREARPTLEALAPVLRAGTSTLKKAVPATRVLRSYAKNSLPAAELAAKVFMRLRDDGVYENLLGVFYGAAAASARFNDKGHILPAYVLLNRCAAPARTPVEGCSANFSHTAPATKARKRSAQKKAPAAAPQAPAPEAPKAAEPAPQQPQVPLLPVDPIKTVTDAVDKVLDRLKEPAKDEQDDGLLGFLLG